MTQKDMQQHLYDIFEAMTIVDLADDDQISIPHDLVEPGRGIDMVQTFRQGQMLTDNSGIVIRMQDGSEFQISVVQSR